MFRQFVEWRKKARERRKAHDLAWNAFVTSSPDGLTEFDRKAEESLRRVIDGISFDKRGTSEPYLYGAIPGTTAVIYLHGDGAQIHDGPSELFWSEYYDYETPDDLVNTLVARARDIWSQHAGEALDK